MLIIRMPYVTVHTCTFERGVSARTRRKPRRLFTRTYAAQFSSKSTAPRRKRPVPAGTPARARRARVDAAPGIVMFSKRAAARRRRAAEPDVSVAVARAERRLEKHSARSSSSTRGAFLGDAVAYAAIALGMCLMLFSRRIPVHGPEDFAPMRRAGRRPRARWRTSSRTWCPAWTPGRWTTSCAPFWSLRARRDARLPRVRPLNVHLPERGQPRCAQRVVLRAGDIVNVDVRGHERGWRSGVYVALRPAAGRCARVGWWTRRGAAQTGAGGVSAGRADR